MHEQVLLMILQYLIWNDNKVNDFREHLNVGYCTVKYPTIFRLK